jgi:hypothetical protein
MRTPVDAIRLVWKLVPLSLLVVMAACSGAPTPNPDPGPPGAGGAGGSAGSRPPTAGTGGSDPGSGGSGGSAGAGGSGGSPPMAGAGGSPQPPPPPPRPGDAGVGVDTGIVMPPPMTPPSAEEPLPPCKRTVNVADSGALGTAIGGAQPGDCIVLADGEYTFPNISAKGTAAAPIVIRAANLLKAAVATGNVQMQGAAYVVVEGLHFRSAGFVKMQDTDHGRISRFRIQRQQTGGEIDWVQVTGTSKYCRVDHNDIGPLSAVGNMIQLGGSGPQIVQYTRIDHNYFHDVTYGGGNGWELIRAGLSGWSFSRAFTVIEQNLFVNGDSDPETISIKSSDNTIRYNTMRSTAGQFTLRHGNNTSVYGNYILGDGQAGSTGLRVYGGNHKIYNNYLAGLSGVAINIDAGTTEDDTGALTDHKVTYNVQVMFNTIVNGRGITLGSGKPLQPRNITVAYNLLQGGGPLITATAGTQARIVGNIVNGNAGVGMGVQAVDPRLVKMGDIFTITAGSPAIDAGDAAMFPFLMEDIDGRPRSKADVGAQELSTAPAKYGLLTEKDVGPAAP